jgi:hypothetical protein
VVLQITIASYHTTKIIIKVVIIHIELYLEWKKNYKYFCCYLLNFLKSFILKYTSVCSSVLVISLFVVSHLQAMTTKTLISSHNYQFLSLDALHSFPIKLHNGTTSYL